MHSYLHDQYKVTYTVQCTLYNAQVTDATHGPLFVSNDLMKSKRNGVHSDASNFDVIYFHRYNDTLSWLDITIFQKNFKL